MNAPWERDSTLRDSRLDDAVDRAVERIRSRTSAYPGSFAELGDALVRTTRGGKRFRPALVVQSHASFGGDGSNPALFDVAASFELLHAAFLLHDDVIDHDLLRRGVPNVAGEFRARARERGADAEAAAHLGDAAAILGGDLLLHEAQRLIALADTTPELRRALLALLDEAVLVSAAGELADVAHAALDERADAGAILAATHDKTAVYSFSAPLQAGALLAGATPAQSAELAACGSELGLAFQLADDLIGAFGTIGQAGKEEGADLREAKQTALIALARASETWPEVQRALSLAHTGPIAVRRAQDALGASGARAQLEQLVRENIARSRARAAASTLPEPTRALLLELARLTEARIP